MLLSHRSGDRETIRQSAKGDLGFATFAQAVSPQVYIFLIDLPRCFLPCQICDLLNETNDPYYESHLRIFIILSAVVRYANLSSEAHELFILGRFGEILGAPTNPAGEVADFHGHVSAHFAVDAPLQRIRHAWRK